MEFEERAADPLAGGLMQGYQCGQLWGAALAAGAQAYRLFGPGPQAEAAAVVASQRIAESFRAQNKHINCIEITQINLESPTKRKIIRFLLKSSVTGSCFGMAARCAQMSFREINTTLSEKPVEAPATPVSCSVILAQKMGISEMQTVMAAGFAGGIGLSGGACGALGTAFWAIGMNHAKAQIGSVGLKIPGTSELIDRFAEAADYEFECAKIVGRKFENLEEHANYLRGGGCSKIIETLAMKGI
jgi:hypothetical protein